MTYADMTILSNAARVWDRSPHAIELVCGRCEADIATGEIGLTPNLEPFVAWTEPAGRDASAAVWIAGDDTRLGDHGYIVITCPRCSSSWRVNAYEQLCASLRALVPCEDDEDEDRESRRVRLALGINLPRPDEDTIAFLDSLAG